MGAFDRTGEAVLEAALPTSTQALRTVRHFRQILLWPLQLIPLHEGSQIQNHWELLREPGPLNPWRDIGAGFGDQDQFRERHYREFTAFLPHVQRFLYGEGVGRRVASAYGDSPIKVFRREEVQQVRVTFAPGEPPTVFDVARVDLYFFYDCDVVMLAVEIHADDLPFDTIQNTLFRFGRAYPAAWDEAGHARNCVYRAEWLAANGSVLAESDYDNREKFLSFVSRHRAPAVAAHWAYLFRPLVLHHTDDKGPIRYRQIEYYRMPFFAYLAMADSAALTRADYVRLGLGTKPGDSSELPFAASHLLDFESRYCYDRYRGERGPQRGANTRLMCCGHAFVMVGDQADPFFCDAERGLLGEFHHQYFLLGLIAHFHRVALLMLSDSLVVAVSRLDLADPESIRAFRRNIRQTFEIFLRFSHRYWFHEVSDQVQMKELFAMWRRHLATEDLYQEVRDELQDMTQYLDSEMFRRHSNTIVRLTVVTIFGLIGAVTTGLLGINLIDEAAAPLSTKIFYFSLTFIPVATLTLYTVMKSRRLSEFLDSLSDERADSVKRMQLLLSVWKRHKRAP